MKSELQFNKCKISDIQGNVAHATAMGPFGSNIKTENYVSSGVPIIRGKNILNGYYDGTELAYLTEEKADELSGSNTFPEDVLLVAQGNVGHVGYIPKDSKYNRFVLSQNLMKITIDQKKAIPLFIFYYLRSPEGQQEILQYRNPTGVPCLAQPLTSFRNILIPLPELNIQKKIVEYLLNLDHEIQNLENQNKILEQIAQAIFKSWFVDFDGVTEWDDSELGKIPKGWKVTTLKNHIDIKHGYAFKGEFFSDKPTKYALLTPGNFKVGGGFKGNKIKYYDGPILEEYVLETDDLLVTMTDLSVMGDTLGFPMYVPKFDSTTFLHNQRLGKINIKNDSYLSTTFLYHLCCSLKYRIEILASLTGSTVKHSSPERIMSFQFVLPEENKIKKFDKIITSIKEKIDRLQEIIIDLKKTRDILLPKLMSGEIRV